MDAIALSRRRVPAQQEFLRCPAPIPCASHPGLRFFFTPMRRPHASTAAPICLPLPFPFPGRFVTHAAASRRDNHLPAYVCATFQCLPLYALTVPHRTGPDILVSQPLTRAFHPPFRACQRPIVTTTARLPSSCTCQCRWGPFLHPRVSALHHATKVIPALAASVSPVTQPPSMQPPSMHMAHLEPLPFNCSHRSMSELSLAASPWRHGDCGVVRLSAAHWCSQRPSLGRVPGNGTAAPDHHRCGRHAKGTAALVCGCRCRWPLRSALIITSESCPSRWHDVGTGLGQGAISPKAAPQAARTAPRPRQLLLLPLHS